MSTNQNKAPIPVKVVSSQDAKHGIAKTLILAFAIVISAASLASGISNIKIPENKYQETVSEDEKIVVIDPQNVIISTKTTTRLCTLSNSPKTVSFGYTNEYTKVLFCTKARFEP